MGYPFAVHIVNASEYIFHELCDLNLSELAAFKPSLGEGPAWIYLNYDIKAVRIVVVLNDLQRVRMILIWIMRTGRKLGFTISRRRSTSFNSFCSVSFDRLFLRTTFTALSMFVILWIARLTSP